jgi:triosephosphate isomerase
MGCRWTMIGHSEERRDKQEIIAAFEPDWNAGDISRNRCAQAVDTLINQEAMAALAQGMNVLLCVGETAEERGDGSFDEQKERIARALSSQVIRHKKVLKDNCVIICSSVCNGYFHDEL